MTNSQSGHINNLAKQLSLGKPDEKKSAFLEIYQLALDHNIYPASIYKLYKQRAQDKLPHNFTVPAINIRGLTYDVAQTIFKIASKLKVKALIFELARSEMSYTRQPPHEYAVQILAAGLKQNFQGPIFIQGDHFHISPQRYREKPETELNDVRQLISEAIDAGFYNIDIDASSLVDYSQPSIKQQQQLNYRLTAQLADFIRKQQPDQTTIALGGEIGHIGGKNSTEPELKAFLDGFSAQQQTKPGLSKVSVQTGTHHGGVVLADGSLADVEVDFEILCSLAKVARDYGLAGTVQHGASTLPEEYFSQFPRSEAIEIHLATELQNIILDHPAFPQDLRQKMYDWLDQNLASEANSDWTAKQFYYKLRKKAWGPFKQQLWSLSTETKQQLCQALEPKIEFFFKQLNVVETEELIQKNTTQISIEKSNINQPWSQTAKTSLTPHGE